MKRVFVNPERCIGCLQCEFACATEHSRSREAARALRETPGPHRRIHVMAGAVPTTAYPDTCRHCDPAPCLTICPSGALVRDPDTDFVVTDAQRCIGCAMCAVVCPFDVITFYPSADGPDPRTAVATRCDGCLDRVRRGEEPACVEACKVGALVFGELNELVAAGRLREGNAELAARTTAVAADADPLAGWHAWGRAEAAAAAADRSLRSDDGHEGKERR